MWESQGRRELSGQKGGDVFGIGVKDDKNEEVEQY